MTYTHLPATLPITLRAAGLKVVEIGGWHGRGRPSSTGGFDPVGVLCHHTGSYDSMTDATNDLAYAKWLAVTGRSDLPAPLCNLALSAEGVVYVCASGRANHAGTAKSSGTVAAGDGNELYIGIEAMNDGSQGWSSAQRDAYVTLCAVLSLKVTGNSAQTVRGHKETSVTGKWDPGKLDMGAFRTDVAAKMKALSTPPPPPVTTHTRWAIRTTGVHETPGGKKLRDIPAGYKFQVVDGSGHGNDGWIETAAGNWVLGADTTTRDPALPSRLSVLSWNVKAGAARVDTVLAELRAMTAEHKPDVVALQECYNLPRFGDAFPGYSFSYQAAGEAKTAGYVSEYPANVMLVRDGVEVKVQAPLEMTESWKGPKVGAMHDPRIHRRVTVLKDGVIWRVVDMHVPPPISGGGNADAIAESNAAMVECLTDFPADEPVIIVGDMNQDNATVVRRVGAPGGAVVDGGGVDLALFRDCTKTKGENLGLHTSDHPAKKWDFEA